MTTDDDKHGAPGRLARGTAALALAVAITSFIANFTALSSFDIWYHLALGRYICQQGTIPRENVLSYTAPHHEGVPLSWLYQAMVYQVYMVGGSALLVTFRALLVASTLAILFLAMRTRGVYTGAALAITGLAGWAARDRFVDRPHVIGLFMLAVYIFLYEQYIAGQSLSPETAGPRARLKSLFWLAPLPFLQVVWTNMHGGAVLGIVVALVFCCGHALELVLRRERPAGTFLPLVLAPLLLALLTAASPMGFRALVFPFQHAETFSATGTKGLFAERMGLLAHGFHWPLVPFFVLLALALLSLVLRLRHLRLSDLGFLLAIVPAFYASRFRGEAVVLAAPFVVAAWRAEAARGAVKRALSSTWLGVLLFLVLTLAGFITDERPWGGGIDPAVHPVDIVKFIKERRLKGKVYNDFELGGFLAWHGISPFIDSRGLGFYPDWLFRKYIQMSFDPDEGRAMAALEELDNKFRFAMAVVQRAQVARLFEKQAEKWRLAYVGPGGSVFVRRE